MRAIARHRDDKEARGKLVSELMALHAISSGLALILYGIVVFIAWKNIQDIRLLLFSLSYLLVNFFACEWYFLGMEQFRYITLRSLFSRLLGLVSIFILINEPRDYYIYYGIITTTAIINSLWNNYYLLKAVRISFKNINWRKHIAVAKLTWFLSLTYGITLMLDNVFLRFMSTAAAVGFYAFSMKIVRASTALLTDPLLVFFPRIVALIREGNKAQLQAIILRNIQLMIFFCVPLSLGIFLLAEEFITVFLGKQFLPAVTDVRILTLFPFLRTFNLFLSKQVLISYDKEKLYLRALITGSLSFVALSLSLSYFFADIGACCAIVMAEAVTLIMSYYYARKVAPDLPLFDLRGFLQACGSSLIFIPIILGISQVWSAPLVILLLSVSLCIIFYVLIQLLVMRNSFAIVVWEAVKRKSLEAIYN